MDYKEKLVGQSAENFWYLGKYRLIDVLMKKVVRNSGLKILNLGSGTGDDISVLRKYGDIYVIDVDSNALNLVDSSLCVEKKVADACSLPYPDGFFDIVVSFDVFEHISDDKKAAQEVRRVLKSDGSLVFTVPAFQFLFSAHDKALDHYRRYSKKEIMNLLSDFNLKTYYWNSMLFFPMALMRLVNKNSKPKVDNAKLPKFVDKLFFKLLSFDNFLIDKGTSSFVGLSICGIGKKK